MSLDLTVTQKNISGMFWLPDQEDQPLSGVLQRKAGKSAKLETSTFNYEGASNWFPNRPKSKDGKPIRLQGEAFFDAMHMPSRKIIHGHDEHGKPLTLINCYASSANSTLARSCQHYSCDAAIFGVHLQKDDLNCHGIRLHLDHLDDWFGRRMFQHHSETEETDNGRKITKIAIPMPRDLTTPLGLPGYARSEFFSSWTMQPGDTEFKLTSRAYLDLYFDEPKGWEDVVHEVHRWQWLMSLATRRPVDVREFALYRSDIRHDDTEDPMIPCYVWMKRRQSPKAPDCRRGGYDFYFTYSDIRSDFPDLIKRWNEIQKPWASVLHRFFAVSHRRGGLWINEQFLFLAQAVESLHRARTGDTDTKGVVDRAAKNAYLNSPPELQQLIGDRGLFVRQFRKTRNYWSHYGEPTPESDPEVLGDIDLYDFNQKLRWIVEFAILREIGVPDHCSTKVWSPQWRGRLVTYE